MPRSLILLDAPSLYFRAFYGIPDSIRSPKDEPVNAICGMLDMTAQLLRAHRPDRLVACFDNDWRPAFRVNALPSYKAHRVAQDGAEEVPDLLTPQVPVIEQFLDAFGLCRLGIDGYEADDVIGSIAAHAGGAVDIVTGDRDLFQLVDDTRPLAVLYTAKGIANIERVDEAVVTAKYAIPGRSYADFAILRGDPSDGLPGVPGIGAKTAAGLLATYGTVQDMLTAIDEKTSTMAPRIRGLLDSSRDYIAAAEVVARVAETAPLPAYDPALPVTPRDPAAVVELAERWGVENSCARLTMALTALAG